MHYILDDVSSIGRFQWKLVSSPLITASGVLTVKPRHESSPMSYLTDHSKEGQNNIF